MDGVLRNDELPAQIGSVEHLRVKGSTISDVVKDGKFFVFASFKIPIGTVRLDHLSIMEVATWFQKTYNAPLIIHIRDDEHFLTGTIRRSKKAPETPVTMADVRARTKAFATELLQCGVDYGRTFVCSTTGRVQAAFRQYLHIAKDTECGQVVGDTAMRREDMNKTNIGMYAHPGMVSAFAHPATHAGLVPPGARCLAITEEDDWGVFEPALRHAAQGTPPPAVVCLPAVPSLRGVGTTAADCATEAGMMENNTIAINNTAKQVQKKINKFAVSGGRETVEEQTERGADLEADVPFALLDLLSPDRALVARLRAEYGTGGSGAIGEDGEVRFMMTGEVKKMAIEMISGRVAAVAGRASEAAGMMEACGTVRML